MRKLETLLLFAILNIVTLSIDFDILNSFGEVHTVIKDTKTTGGALLRHQRFSEYQEHLGKDVFGNYYVYFGSRRNHGVVSEVKIEGRKTIYQPNTLYIKTEGKFHHQHIFIDFNREDKEYLKDNKKIVLIYITSEGVLYKRWYL